MADISKYNHTLVEKKWQDKWRETKEYEPGILHTDSSKKFYNLWMFPYPSAEGLHAGHAFASTGSDVIGRFQRMQGKTVFQPIGYDSFGIHSENFAIKIGETPQKMLSRATKHYEEQFRSMGHGYDWSRTVTTSEVEYYKWTQWLFVQMFKAGLAYKKKAFVNWCPGCKTVLSDEQIVTPAQAGKFPPEFNSIEEVPEGVRVCERCGNIPQRKELSQWFFRITDYADRLLQNLDKIDWTEKVKVAQKEWIGKSKGLAIDFKIENSEANITVWTKFWETVFGTTFLVLAPEHPIIKDLNIPEAKKVEVADYITQALNKSEQQRKEAAANKTGVFTGVFAVNPVNGQKVPIWVTDYVLWGVGTGAVMGVPAHDDRDFDFAKKYQIDIVQVVAFQDQSINKKVADKQIAYEGAGKLMNSGKFDGMEAWGEGKEKMAAWMADEGFAHWETTYHLRDWLISRQRYWGPPIPMLYCAKCAQDGKSWLSEHKPLIRKENADWEHAGWYPEENLPVQLPVIEDYQPKGTGKGPLANHPDFYEVVCPACGSQAERETDVSDTFVDSAWYFLRYPSVDAQTASSMPFDKQITANWLPVDLYFGGAEHSVLHLMYARFVNQVLFDLKLLTFEEPFPKFYAHGLMIKDGAKMSKSKGNVVNPDEYVEKFGADTLRLYLMFMGPMDGYPDFRDSGMEGMARFVNRLWTIFSQMSENNEDQELTVKLHLTIKKTTTDISKFGYNTALSTIMEYVNLILEKKNYSKMYLKPLVQMMAPFAPHLAEEVWEMMGEDYSIHKSSWPAFKEELTKLTEQTVVVQVNGKLRGQLIVDNKDIDDKENIFQLAQNLEGVKMHLTDKQIVNKIYVPGKIVNFVAK